MLCKNKRYHYIKDTGGERRKLDKTGKKEGKAGFFGKERGNTKKGDRPLFLPRLILSVLIFKRIGVVSS